MKRIYSNNALFIGILLSVLQAPDISAAVTHTPQTSSEQQNGKASQKEIDEANKVLKELEDSHKELFDTYGHTDDPYYGGYLSPWTIGAAHKLVEKIAGLNKQYHQLQKKYPNEITAKPSFKMMEVPPHSEYTKGRDLPTTKK